MGTAGHSLTLSHVDDMVRAVRKQHPDLLLISTEDGTKVASHRNLLAFFSSTFSHLLAEHDQGETVLKVFVEVGSIGLFAFHRILKSAGRSALADWTLASKALQLFNVEIRPRSFEENGQTENKSSAYEEFLRNSFISHQNNKSEDEEKKFTKLERSSKVALAQSLSIHRPDLVLIAEDGGKVLGHRSLLSLFSSVFRQLLPLHDQHESLLALSLPFTSEPLFAFHRIYESGGRTSAADWDLAKDVLAFMEVAIDQSQDEKEEQASVEFLLNSKLKVKESTIPYFKGEIKNDMNDNHDSEDDDNFIDDEDDEDYQDEYFDKKKRSKQERLGKLEWKCKHCDASFSSRSTRYRHQISHEEERSKDKEVKAEVGDAERHLDDDDNDDWTDDPTAPKKKGIGTKRGKKMSDNRRVYSCKKCKQTFKQKPAYQQHKLSHGIDPGEDDSPDDGDDKGDEKPFTCNLCSGAQFKRKSSLVKHKIVDHGETVTCDHCPLQFDNPNNWTKHVKSHRTAQCDICAKMFTEVQLRVHKRLNHEQPKKQCPLCPAKVQMLRVHMENCHTGELRTCTACPFTSRRKADIDVHYRKMHTDLNKQTCHGCGEVFKKLKAHLMRTKCGTGFKAEANVPCPHCPKMFTHKMGVDKHINAIHLQIKNKHCQFCDYRTYNMFNLNLHIANRHKGEKMEKQQCNHCDKVVMSMDWHLKIYHPEVYHPGAQ